MRAHKQLHNIEPVYNKSSRVLILGSFPSVKSREIEFFYGHPQNRFWRLLAALLKENTPKSTQDKKQLLLKHNIAVWDVIKECDIVGSSDTSITNALPNDISLILDSADIRAILCNGTKAYELYNKYIFPTTGREALRLPSTSPANAACSLDKLCEKWKIITEYL